MWIGDTRSEPTKKPSMGSCGFRRKVYGLLWAGSRDAIAAARSSSQVDDGSPVRVGSRESFQNVHSVRVPAFLLENIPAQSVPAGFHQRFDDVVLSERQAGFCLPVQPGLVAWSAEYNQPIVRKELAPLAPELLHRLMRTSHSGTARPGKESAA